MISDVEILEFKRSEAQKYLPVLKEVVEKHADKELIGFVQAVVDSYMLHECRLSYLGERGKTNDEA